MRPSRYLGCLFGAAMLMSLSLPGVARADSTQASSDGKGIAGGVLLGAEAVLLTEAAIDVKPHWLYYVGGGVGAVGGGIAGYYLEDSLEPKGNMFLLAGGMLLVIPTVVAVLSATAYETDATMTADSPTDDLPADPTMPVSQVQEESEPPPPEAPAVAPESSTDSPSSPEPVPSTTPAPTSSPLPATGEPTVPSATEPAAPESRRGGPRSRPTRSRPTRDIRRLSPAERVAAFSLVGGSAQKGVHVGIPSIEVRESYSPREVAEFGVQQAPEIRVSVVGLAF